MKNKRIVLVTGGIKSGKSHFAEQLAAALGKHVMYLATAQAFDHEMTLRIQNHRDRRPPHWGTIEEPLRAAQTVKNLESRWNVLMLDCLTLLITNLMFEQEQIKGMQFTVEDQIPVLNEIAGLVEAIKQTDAHVIIVSNEVGQTLVSDNFLGRQFQELVGTANQMIASAADEVYLVVSGCPLELKNRR